MYLTYLSTRPAGRRHRCVITWEQCPRPHRHALRTYHKRSSRQKLPSLLIAPLLRLPPHAWMQVNCLSSEGTTPRQQEHHDATLQRSHPGPVAHSIHSLFFAFWKKKPPPSLSLQRLDESCLLPSIFAQHYWPYHWRKSELPCRGKLEFRAR